MINIVKHNRSVSVVRKADPRWATSVDREIAYFTCHYQSDVDEYAQELLELLAALNEECEIVEG